MFHPLRSARSEGLRGESGGGFGLSSFVVGRWLSQEGSRFYREAQGCQEAVAPLALHRRLPHAATTSPSLGLPPSSEGAGRALLPVALPSASSSSSPHPAPLGALPGTAAPRAQEAASPPGTALAKNRRERRHARLFHPDPAPATSPRASRSAGAENSLPLPRQLTPAPRPPLPRRSQARSSR